ncbi:DUF543-domain-containing protein [Conidiobolus coronatus NRRL 28638]|uniref:MICOS complex subunit MIC10 n=1 Tax=Conidiobolus coronatus (strain ATCC 28846 / CBS 209.66 / NRRL 28638) TaxID=796925 RepID=A0A137PIM5_CONC2|nr:DUF543-domain-containing protein [Conidiobolus coronatus NRRL 28638]|eukprot:KXN74858.1 DUF543-domain-containing protein [Conidiobolus coronatus NRRL 28638]
MSQTPEASKFSNKIEAISVPSEQFLSEKRDRCISNLIVNGGLGLCLGVVTSVVFFKRRAFPVYLGAGFGLGTALADCQRSFHMGFQYKEKKL